MFLDPGFPDPRQADDHGLLAVGGDFEPDFLLAAYRRGIFPWPSEELPYAWFSPDPRLVLVPSELQVSRSLRKEVRRERFELRFDTAFEEVVRRCAESPRPGQEGTWIQPALRRGFEKLHDLGYAHSLEAWRRGELVGGLYGLALGSMFCGESMFYLEPNASKVAFVGLVRTLDAWGFDLVDCQVHTPHLERFGAEEWPRDLFLDVLDECLLVPGRPGSWRYETVRLDPVRRKRRPARARSRLLESLETPPPEDFDAWIRLLQGSLPTAPKVRRSARTTEDPDDETDSRRVG